MYEVVTELGQRYIYLYYKFFMGHENQFLTAELIRSTRFVDCWGSWIEGGQHFHMALSISREITVCCILQAISQENWKSVEKTITDG